MRTITATELARNLRQVLDRLRADGEEVVIERNHEPIARLVPGPGRQTALQAMADLYRTLPAKSAAGWLQDARGTSLLDQTVDEGIKDAWDS